MKTTTITTRTTRLINRFDNELKSLLMNDLRGKKHHKTATVQNMQPSAMQVMKIA